MSNDDEVTQFPVAVVATPGLRSIWSTNPGPTTVLYANAALEWTKNRTIGDFVDQKMDQFYPSSSYDGDSDDEDDSNEDDDDSFGGEDGRDFLYQQSMFPSPSHSTHPFTVEPSMIPSSSSVDKGKGKASTDNSHSMPSLASVAHQLHAQPTATHYPPTFLHASTPTRPVDTLDAYMESPRPEDLLSTSLTTFARDEATSDVDMLSPSATQDEMDTEADIQGTTSSASSASNDFLPYTHLQSSRIAVDHAGSTASLISMASKFSQISLLDPDFNIQHFLSLLVASPERAQDYLTSAGTSKSGKHTTVVGEMVASTRVVTTAYNAAHINGWNRPLNHDVIVDNAHFTVTFFSTIMELYIKKNGPRELNCKSNYSIV